MVCVLQELTYEYLCVIGSDVCGVYVTGSDVSCGCYRK